MHPEPTRDGVGEKDPFEGHCSHNNHIYLSPSPVVSFSGKGADRNGH